MFAAMAGEAGCRQNEIAAMAAALPGRNGLTRGNPAQSTWLDDSGAFAAAQRAIPLLPEDHLDRQPFVDVELIFVCRARLDDRAGLLQQLQIDAASGAVLSDARILRECYKKWREATPQHVYGDFAFIAWERWSRRTVAATDHLGNFPVFYCKSGGRILFATQLSALLACPTVRANLDPAELERAAAGKPARPGRTMFEGINVLPGGQLLIHHYELIRVDQWWHPQTAPRDLYAHPRDYVDEARALFDSAVASRLRSRGGVIATLSGGLDSPLVAVTAARQMQSAGKVLEAFTAIPHDDVAWATAVADFQPNIRQRMVSVEGKVPLDILTIAHSAAHTTVCNPASLLWKWQMSSRAAHNRVHVILCAEHGNRSIGYTGDLSDASFLPMRRLASFAQQTFDQVRCIGAGPRAIHRLTGDIHALRDDSQLPAEEPHNSEREVFARAMTTPHSAGRVDFMAQFGVEWLDPTADRKLIERLLTFPLHIFRVGHRPRGLARELARGRLPDCVRLRRSRDAHFPDSPAWFMQRADDYRRAFATIRASSVCAAFLDLQQLEPLLERLCAGNGSPAQAVALHRALDAGLFATARESGSGAEANCPTGNGNTPVRDSGIPTSRVFGEVDSGLRARA
jgi:asparagine synthase (glutamine-hydrolysing)